MTAGALGVGSRISARDLSLNREIPPVLQKNIDFRQLNAARIGRDVELRIGQLLKTQNAFPAKVLILIIIKELLGLDPVHFARRSS